MDLRRRTTHALATAGAFLIVGALSLGSGVAVAVPAQPGPAADDDKATTTSSEKSGDKPSKKPRKSTTTTETTDTTDTTRSTRSTATTATTRPTATTATTARTATPGTTATTRPATTSSTAARATVSPSEDTSSTTGPANGTDPNAPATTSPSSNRPTARSGSGLPPGIYPIGPGSRSVGSSPSATTAPAPAAAVAPPPAPVAAAETQPAEVTTSSTAVAGVADPATNTGPGSDVSGTGADQGVSPGSQRRSSQLGQTGDGTRHLIMFGGVALLLGAVVVAFTGRDVPSPAGDPPAAGPARQRPRPRRELDGWEDGVPLAPAKRELARHRLGISDGFVTPDDAP